MVVATHEMGFAKEVILE